MMFKPKLSISKKLLLIKFDRKKSLFLINFKIDSKTKFCKFFPNLTGVLNDLKAIELSKSIKMNFIKQKSL